MEGDRRAAGAEATVVFEHQEKPEKLKKKDILKIISINQSSTGALRPVQMMTLVS